MKRILTAVLAVVMGLGCLAMFSACKATTYTIKYTIDGKEITGVLPTSYEAYNKEAVDLWMPAPQEGAFFDGWHIREDFSDPSIMDKIPEQSIGDRHFYGRFIKESYNITYTVEGQVETGGTPNSYKPLQDPVALWVPDEPDSEVIFDGWYTDADFTSAKTTQLPRTEMEDKTYYGRFVSKTDASSIRYFIEDVDVTASSTLKYYTLSASPTTLWLPSYNTKLFKFEGWYDNPACTGTEITEIPANTEGDKIYYGKYSEPVGYGDTRQKITNFTVSGGNNGAKSLSDFYGKPVVLNFWASDCGPCVQEMPHFQKLFKELGDRVEFMMIGTTPVYGATATEMRNFITSNNYEFSYYLNMDGSVYRSINPSGSGIPMTVFVDRWGYLVRKEIKSLTEADLRREIANIYQP